MLNGGWGRWLFDGRHGVPFSLDCRVRVVMESYRSAQTRVSLSDRVLLDLKLPKVDGHQIKSTPHLRPVANHALTGSKRQADLVVSYGRFAVSVLQKPMSYDGFCELMAEVESNWLSRNVVITRDTDNDGIGDR